MMPQRTGLTSADLEDAVRGEARALHCLGHIVEERHQQHRLAAQVCECRSITARLLQGNANISRTICLKVVNATTFCRPDMHSFTTAFQAGYATTLTLARCSGALVLECTEAVDEPVLSK